MQWSDWSSDVCSSDLTGNLFIMSRERLMDEARMLLNLCESCWQEALLAYRIGEKIKVVFLDNLSSLCWGMKENEADSWEQVLSWLLMLRQSGIAIIIVHHTNRDGNEMRGTSRREDAADWVIKVSPNFKFAKIDKGTAFTTTFTKNREDNGDHEESMDWTFVTEDGKTNVNWKSTDLETRVYELIRNDGMELCSDIAEGLGINKMDVSKCAKRLMDKGFIRKEGRGYVLSYNPADNSEITLEKD
jgi:biotin operon repressor